MQPRMRKTGVGKVFMTTDAVGGVWTYALELLRGLADAGIQVDLAVLGPPPSAAQGRAVVGVPGAHMLVTGLALDWTARTPAELDLATQRLQGLASSSGADLVHLNAPGLAGLDHWQQPLVAAAHSCVASWWEACGSGPLPSALAWRARRTAAGLRAADAVIAPSRSFARLLRRIYGPVRRLSVVHNARQTAPVSDDRERDIVLTAGRLWDPAKNVECIDRASALLATPIYAAGPTEGPNGERASAANLKLLGELDESALQSQYARTRLFVSMSRYEPFGLSILEAAQAGSALVLSDIATFRELWHGAACFVPAEDPVELARIVDWLIKHPAVRLDLARAALARARQYTVESLVAATLNIYGDAGVAHLRRAQTKNVA
jgi:glycosyltransferase involved in cell wall biosynthesis